MPRSAGVRRLVIVGAWAALAIGGPGPMPPTNLARADEPAAVEPGAAPTRYVLPRPRSAVRGRGPGEPSGWWFGTTGIVAALALFGAASLASRRFLPRKAEAPRSLRVVGRASLSPKHAVHLLRVGDRTLVIGTGPQGPPALLGEWADPRPTPGAGVRIGDDP